MRKAERINAVTAYERHLHSRYVSEVWGRYFLEGDWVKADVSSGRSEYSPYFESSLLIEFSKLKQMAGHKGLMAFVHRYGLPRVTGKIYNYEGRPQGVGLDDHLFKCDAVEEGLRAVGTADSYSERWHDGSK